MIRNAMFGLFGLSLLALSSASAFAAPVTHHAAKARIVAVASAPAGGDTAAATGDKPEKKAKKSTKKDKAAKAEPAKEMKTSTPVPTPATK